MSISDLVRVDAAYTRSINLERDWETNAELTSYVPTVRACETLKRFVAAQEPGDRPRAWALIGPYGAGKSAFALFLSKLTSNPGSPAAVAALRTLRAADRPLANKLRDIVGSGLGYCTVLLTGSAEPLAKRFLLALDRAANQFWSARKGRQPQVIRRIQRAIDLEDFAGTEILDIVQDLRAAVGRAGGRGLLVVIDELGKFLEYEARHRDVNDIYLLQMLAEAAVRGGSVPINVLVLLHQAFEQYAAGFSEQLKNEWTKVQGRFEGVSFIETTEQVMRVISAAIHTTLNDTTKRRVRKETRQIATRLEETKALPGPMSLATAQELFEACYPLHPVSLVLLPTLAQKVAQNERTIFSYLGGQEPHGFLETLTRLEPAEDGLPWVKPWHIFDYFVASQAGLLADPLTRRRWAEVVTALERLGDAPAAEVSLLKTIGLLNLAGVQGGFKASPEIVRLCFAARPAEFEAAVGALEGRSLITFRKFSGEYRVWEGSDFDLEEALAQERGQLGQIGLADVLNQRLPLPPVVARRYSIETGTLRYFTARFVDHNTHVAECDIRQPTLLICLALSPDDVERFTSLAASWRNELAVFAIRPDGLEIRSAVAEVLAMQRVQRSSPQLGVDPVAQREVRDRLALAARREQQALASILEEPQVGQWYCHRHARRVATKRDVQELLSDALRHTYSQAPRLHNELINRDKPSSSANAGRNKLLQAMLQHAHEAELGIEKFPAEKAMYLSVLRSTGIHRLHAEGWRFGSPEPDPGARNDVCGVWAHMEGFLDRAVSDPLTLQQLFDELQAPPFGVKAGVLPILFLAMWHAHQDEIALYEDGNFSPFLNFELVERMVRNSGAIAVQKVGLASIREAVFQKYAQAITGEGLAEVSPLGVVKPLAKFMINLPEYSKKTKSISPVAQAVREAFFGAKAPAELLFSRLPRACGFNDLHSHDYSKKEFEQFFQSLTTALKELGSAYHQLLQQLRFGLQTAFAMEPRLALHELRSRLQGRFAGLQDFTIDTHGLKAFIGRLTDTYGDDGNWLVSVGSLLGRKPPERWTDDDAAVADYRLAEYAARVDELFRLRYESEQHRKEANGDFDVMLVRTVRQGVGEAGRAVIFEKSEERALKAALRSVRATLERTVDDERLRLAVLATLLDEQMRPTSADHYAVGQNDRRGETTEKGAL